MKQQSLFDFLPKLEPNVGDWAEEAGAIIPQIMLRKGMKVMMDKSTVSHPWFRCGVIEDIIRHEGHVRVIVYDGERQRSLIDYPRVQLHECMPWEWYEMRMQRIGRKK